MEHEKLIKISNEIATFIIKNNLDKWDLDIEDFLVSLGAAFYEVFPEVEFSFEQVFTRFKNGILIKIIEELRNDK